MITDTHTYAHTLSIFLFFLLLPISYRLLFNSIYFIHLYIIFLHSHQGLWIYLPVVTYLLSIAQLLYVVLVKCYFKCKICLVKNKSRMLINKIDTSHYFNGFKFFHNVSYTITSTESKWVRHTQKYNSWLKIREKKSDNISRLI